MLSYFVFTVDRLKTSSVSLKSGNLCEMFVKFNQICIIGYSDSDVINISRASGVSSEL